MLTISSTIRRTETPDGTVLLEVEQGQMFSLNPVGSRILELVGSGCDEHEIASQISAAYGAEIDVVRADVREFLESLGRHGILQPGERDTGERQEMRHGGSDPT
jgi:hypothetical protein